MSARTHSLSRRYNLPYPSFRDSSASAPQPFLSCSLLAGASLQRRRDEAAWRFPRPSDKKLLQQTLAVGVISRSVLESAALPGELHHRCSTYTLPENGIQSVEHHRERSPRSRTDRSDEFIKTGRCAVAPPSGFARMMPSIAGSFANTVVGEGQGDEAGHLGSHPTMNAGLSSDSVPTARPI